MGTYACQLTACWLDWARAGVIRPEIIIPRSSAAPTGQGTGGTAGTAERSGLRIGDQVRIIRDPMFGRIGQVKGLPTDLREIETESHVRVIEVGFADGSATVVPRSNVEIIEGRV